jgi:3-phosphoshikimate 1-carboxyvinyltransferase
MVRALCDQPIEIQNLSKAEDTEFLAEALTQKKGQVFVGQGGTTIRFFLAFAATQSLHLTIEGTPRLNQRPIADLVEALKKLGANIRYTQNEGFAPLELTGFQQKETQLEVPAKTSSQFASALLLVAPTLPKGLELTIRKPIVSQSYLNLTLKALSYFGINYQLRSSKSKLSVQIPAQAYQAKNYFVETDWSSAAYWFSIALLKPDCRIFLPNLRLESAQPDSIVAQLTKGFGLVCRANDSGLSLRRELDIEPAYFQADFSDCPDLAQTFAFLCTALKVPFKLLGLSTLKHKETDRLAALKTELSKLGAQVKTHESSLWVEKFGDISSLSLETYGDHRMALAAAPLSLLYPELKIQEPEVVKKSYPDFWQDFKVLTESGK